MEFMLFFFPFPPILPFSSPNGARRIRDTAITFRLARTRLVIRNKLRLETTPKRYHRMHEHADRVPATDGVLRAIQVLRPRVGVEAFNVCHPFVVHGLDGVADLRVRLRLIVICVPEPRTPVTEVAANDKDVLGVRDVRLHDVGVERLGGGCEAPDDQGYDLDGALFWETAADERHLHLEAVLLDIRSCGQRRGRHPGCLELVPELLHGVRVDRQRPENGVEGLVCRRRDVLEVFSVARAEDKDALYELPARVGCEVVPQDAVRRAGCRTAEAEPGVGADDGGEAARRCRWGVHPVGDGEESVQLDAELCGVAAIPRSSVRSRSHCRSIYKKILDIRVNSNKVQKL
eukprot:PhM_4_TR6088/c0_g1_i1/m.74604